MNLSRRRPLIVTSRRRANAAATSAAAVTVVVATAVAAAAATVAVALRSIGIFGSNQGTEASNMMYRSGGARQKVQLKVLF